jgi:amino acid permease
MLFVVQVGWVGTSIIMMKTQIGLGVLSIPAAFDILGMVPGVICMMVIAVLTTWGAYVIGPFKLKHPEIYGIDDAAGLVFGRVGRELLSIGFVLCELSRALCRSHLLTYRVY